MKLGNTTIGGMSFGSTRIGGAKLGNTLVFQSGGGIPDGPVDWIETDGVAYINSGITGSQPKGVRAMATFIAGDYSLIGSRTNLSTDTRFIPIAVGSKQLAYGYNYYYTKGSIADAIDNGVPVIVECAFKNNPQLFRYKAVGDNSFAETAAGTSTSKVNTSLDMYIFGANIAGAVAHAMSGVRIHYLKIYSDFAMSTLVFDGIPYKYNGEFGLWDRVSNTFKGNAAASGAFTGGLYGEKPYTQVDYIETDGAAYIDTGVMGDDPKAVEMKFTPAGTTNNMQSLLGTTNGSENADTFLMAQITSGGGLGFAHYYYYSSGAPSIADSISNRTPVIVKSAMKKDSQVLRVKQDGESAFTTFSKANSNSIATHKPMYLLAANSPSAGSGIRNCLSGTRLYYCKIYSKDDYTDLIFDGVPCLYMGEYGLWDNITNSFFGNIAGSGAFSGPSNS